MSLSDNGVPPLAKTEDSTVSGFARQRRALLLALQFLTVIPIKGNETLDKAALGYSLLYYPLVGLLIGLLLLGVAGFGSWLFSPLLAATLVVAAWVLLTGALHIDGLADCADAWVGGFGDRERTLALMKDPTSGPVAVAVVVLLLLIKVAAVQELLSLSAGVAAGFSFWWAVLIAPVMGRLCLLPLLLTTPYIRAAGLGEVLSQYFPRRAARWVCLVVGGLLLLEGAVGLAVMLVAASLLWFLRRQMLQRLGGCTGDTLGATTELVEAGVLLALLAVL